MAIVSHQNQMKNKVLLFNPRAVSSKNYRIPNSVLQVAASIDDKYEWVIVDGNRERDPWEVIHRYFSSGEFKYFGSTVMPGPQLTQAIPYSKKIREQFPDIVIIWGGYFAANQYKVALNSGFVDFVVNGPGDHAFPMLLDALEHGTPYEFIPNLIYRSVDDELLKTSKNALFDQDVLPKLPYDKLNEFYDIKGYLRPTHLGTETIENRSVATRCLPSRPAGSE